MRPGRNDPCPCGSGKKYKHCCAMQSVPGVAAAAAGAAARASQTSLDPREIAALVALVDQNRLEDAERGARTLLARHGAVGILWKILSVSQLRQGRDALDALRRAAALMPNDAEAQRNLGATLHDREHWAEAWEVLSRALAMEPDDVDTLVHAADALRGLGRTGEAVPLYRRAVARDAGAIEAHNNLGNALLEMGDFEGSAGSYGRALQLRPGDVAILLNLGRSLRDWGRRREAVAVYSRLVERNPDHAEAHGHLGTLLFETRRVDEAERSFRRALQLRPDDAAAHVNLGFALRQLRRAEEAEESCRAALALDPRHAPALSFLAELHTDRGDFPGARALFERAIAADANFTAAYCGIAIHQKMTVDDTAWLHGAQSLVQRPQPLSQAIALRHALGKYFDDIGNYDEAFAHYRTANELTKRYGARYDGATFAQRVTRSMLEYDAASIRRQRPAASTSETPVFIVGMPRSGTSLAEQILASHPEVFGAGEVTFWNALEQIPREAGRGGSVPDGAARPGEGVAARAGEAVGAAEDAARVANLADEYLAHLRSLSGAARVVDKMPANFLYLGLIHAAFPRARIIHMQRHPIDTCLSIYFQNFFNMGPHANDLDDLAHYYGQYIRITNHWRAVLPAGTLLEVPYEALVQDQEAWSRKMIGFIGLPWDPRCLDFHRTERTVLTASSWQVRQKMNRTSAGRWRRYERHVGPLRRLVSDA